MRARTWIRLSRSRRRSGRAERPANCRVALAGLGLAVLARLMNAASVRNLRLEPGPRDQAIAGVGEMGAALNRLGTPPGAAVSGSPNIGGFCGKCMGQNSAWVGAADTCDCVEARRSTEARRRARHLLRARTDAQAGRSLAGDAGGSTRASGDRRHGGDRSRARGWRPDRRATNAFRRDAGRARRCAERFSRRAGVKLRVPTSERLVAGAAIDRGRIWARLCGHRDSLLRDAAHLIERGPSHRALRACAGAARHATTGRDPLPEIGSDRGDGWQHGQPVILPPLAEGVATGMAINNRGEVAGLSALSADGNHMHAVAWKR